MLENQDPEIQEKIAALSSHAGEWRANIGSRIVAARTIGGVLAAIDSELACVGIAAEPGKLRFCGVHGGGGIVSGWIWLA